MLRKMLEKAVLWRSPARWLLLSIMVGVVAGCGGIAFQVTEQVIFHFASQQFAGFSPQEAAGEGRLFANADTPLDPLRLLLILAGGGLAAGLLVQTFARGRGARHRCRHRSLSPETGLHTPRRASDKTARLGHHDWHWRLGRTRRPNRPDRRRLRLNARDLAAAVGARSPHPIGGRHGSRHRLDLSPPLAGALFAAEILYRDADLETDVIVPAAVSSIVGYTIISFWLPPEMRFVPLFGDSLHHRLTSLVELLPMTLLALGLVAVGIVYIKIFYGVHNWSKRLPIPAFVRPAIGAVVAGLLGLGLFYLTGQNRNALAVLGTGYGTLQQAAADPAKVGMTMLLGVALIKVLTTSATIGSGGSGGVFGPSMVIGGCTGGAMGQGLHRLWPSLVPEPAIYTVVGMAGFFAGCAHAPISTIVMVSELTGDYSLLVPAMFVSTLCFVLCHGWTLYEKQVPSRLDSPAHRGDFLVNVLEGIKVKNVPWVDRTTVPESMSLEEIVHLLAQPAALFSRHRRRWRVCRHLLHQRRARLSIQRRDLEPGQCAQRDEHARDLGNAGRRFEHSPDPLHRAQPGRVTRRRRRSAAAIARHAAPQGCDRVLQPAFGIVPKR